MGVAPEPPSDSGGIGRVSFDREPFTYAYVLVSSPILPAGLPTQQSSSYLPLATGAAA